MKMTCWFTKGSYFLKESFDTTSLRKVRAASPENLKLVALERPLSPNLLSILAPEVVEARADVTDQLEDNSRVFSHFSIIVAEDKRLPVSSRNFTCG